LWGCVDNGVPAAAAVVDGEAAPLTLSAPNVVAAAVPNVPDAVVVVSTSKVGDTASDLSPSPPCSSPSIEAFPSPSPFPFR